MSVVSTAFGIWLVWRMRQKFQTLASIILPKLELELGNVRDYNTIQVFCAKVQSLDRILSVVWGVCILAWEISDLWCNGLVLLINLNSRHFIVNFEWPIIPFDKGIGFENYSFIIRGRVLVIHIRRTCLNVKFPIDHCKWLSVFGSLVLILHIYSCSASLSQLRIFFSVCNLHKHLWCWLLVSFGIWADDKVTVLEAEKRAWDNSPEAQAKREALNPWQGKEKKAEKSS